MSEVSTTSVSAFDQNAVFRARIKDKGFSKRKGGSMHNAWSSDTRRAEVAAIRKPSMSAVWVEVEPNANVHMAFQWEPPEPSTDLKEEPRNAVEDWAICLQGSTELPKDVFQWEHHPPCPYTNGGAETCVRIVECLRPSCPRCCSRTKLS